MYSETDIQSAVAAGILTPETAAALRDHVAAKRGIPPGDEEHFRLLGGFNDVFITLAILLVLILPISFGQGFFVAAVAWGLAEVVTRKRRLALPSIVLLVAFSLGIFLESASIGGNVARQALWTSPAAPLAPASAIAFGATFVHWWRFRVPLAQAVLAGLALATIVFAASAYIPGASGMTWPLLGVGGAAIFAYAMWWDLSDRERRTHRADAAFWVHLLAAPLIAHSVFRAVGVFDADSPAWAPIVLTIYIFFSLVAIIVDRRAILVSGLGYALFAVAGLMDDAGGGFLVATLLLGGALLLLGLFWSNARAAVVVHLPDEWRRRLPPTERPG